MPREMLEGGHSDEANVLGYRANLLYHELLHIVFAWLLGVSGYLILNMYKQQLHELIHRLGDQFGNDIRRGSMATAVDHSSLPDSFHLVWFIDF